MREILYLYVGQIAVQLGEHCWKLYCLEHGIDNSGTLVDNETTKESKGIFFSETGKDDHISVGGHELRHGRTLQCLPSHISDAERQLTSFVHTVGRAPENQPKVSSPSLNSINSVIT
ncbi:alpha-tubulin 1-like [Tropilaelaps mercedesae]|uniref:Alpha-tubulin 1-like n=1 Tax=Tropilaelaps mercedesae TaxID=418985 RepID=A0A1V9X9K3_9ACAR|nr:alpha-tubulin 1-like [Tropilaelaps mercedesae]